MKTYDSFFEDILADCVEEFGGKSPSDDILTFKEYANELEAIALNPIPCWQKTSIVGNGLFQTKNGPALIYGGYFVMLSDLIERLPKID